MAAAGVRVCDVAAAWDLSETSAARILTGERPVSWERLGRLPSRLVVELCSRWSATAEKRPTRSVDGETLDVTVQLGRLTDEVRGAIADGQVSDDERRRIRDAAVRLLGEVQDVLVAVS